MLKELEDKFDHQRLLNDLTTLNIASHDIYVTSPDGKGYQFPHGYEFGSKYNEKEFTVVNNIFLGTYVEEVIKEVDKKYNVCRARYMTLTPPEKRGYSYHQDKTARLHIPLVTNPECIFLVEDVVYRASKLGQLYWLDTTKKHTALNLSWTPRTHLVFCLR